MKIIRVGKVQELTSLSRTTIYRLEQANKFPSRIQLGEQAVGWIESEIESWIESRTRGIKPESM